MYLIVLLVLYSTNIKERIFILTIKNNEIEDLISVADEDIPTKKIPSAYTKKRTKPFIKGPIDLEWISRVALLPGKSLNVGLALMYLKGLTKSGEDLRLSLKHLKYFNVSRKTTNKVLDLMRKAGLVKIKKSQGRKHRIDIIDGEDK